MLKRVIKLYQGDYIFEEGDASESMYIIEKGDVAIIKKKEKLIVKLADLTTDDLFGEMAFFDKSTRSASAVVTSTFVQLAVLPYDALEDQYNDMPSWLKTIIKTINSNLLVANTRIQELEKIIKINDLT